MIAPREGRNTMSYDDGKYAFGVDAFGWDLTPPREDFGYVLGWAVLGEPLGDHDDEGCEAARAIGSAILETEEMVAIKAVLLALSSINVFGAPRVDVLRLAGLPEIVIEWVMQR